MTECFISNFVKIRPPLEGCQTDILEWIAKAHTQSELLSKSSSPKQFYESILFSLKKIGLGSGKIEKRGILVPDFLEERWETAQIFRLDKSQTGLSLTEKTKFFDEHASLILEHFYPGSELLPENLIHVTCTGYSSPSAAQKLVSKRASYHTQITHAYHMGCYASLPAIGMAVGFLSSFEKHCVDIVHTEICSLHMNPSKHSQGQLVIESLFADGFIKYSLKKEPEGPCFKVISLLEEIIPNSSQSMSWACEEWGFGMTIAKEVPSLIASAIEPFLKKLAQKANLETQQLLKKAIFAIHPGGPKIIEQLAKILKLSPNQVFHSKEILREYGNMSSATLPHIWEKMTLDAAVAPETFIVSFAFGPGLTLSGAIFQKKDKRCICG